MSKIGNPVRVLRVQPLLPSLPPIVAPVQQHAGADAVPQHVR